MNVFKRIQLIGQRIKEWSLPFLGFVFVMMLASLQGPTVSDAALPTTRANTVEFYMGSYDGDGTTGKNSDTDQTFAQLNIELAEAGVNITNVFIVVEIHFETYDCSRELKIYEELKLLKSYTRANAKFYSLCPEHAWVIDLEKHLLSAPDRDDKMKGGDSI